MDQILLATKLYPPVIRENLVHRARLVDQLQAGLSAEAGFGRKLTLISAPAGYGKSILAAEWLATAPAPAVWLSLDESDNDPARFLAYLLAAFQGVNASLGVVAQAMLQAPQPPPSEVVLTALLNDLAAAEPLILVLDDYHAIHNQHIHKLVAYAPGASAARALHLVILTREDPLLPISRLLARGQAFQLRQDDLRFALGETAEFLSRTMGLYLPPVRPG